MHSDDTATISIVRDDAEAPELVNVPAFAVGELPGPDYGALPIIPSAVARQLNLPVVIGGLVAMPQTEITPLQLNLLNRELRHEFGLSPQSGYGLIYANTVSDYTPSDTESALIAGAATLVALAAAWIATALAATESRPDLATMSAVGAAPSYRKRFVASQAVAIAGVGSLLGVVAGIAVGVAFVLYQRAAAIARSAAAGTGYVDSTWVVTIPWWQVLALLITIPLLALLGSWAVTRGRETLTRRA